MQRGEFVAKILEQIAVRLDRDFSLGEDKPQDVIARTTSIIATSSFRRKRFTPELGRRSRASREIHVQRRTAFDLNWFLVRGLTIDPGFQGELAGGKTG
jgi:hypothetical protein